MFIVCSFLARVRYACFASPRTMKAVFFTNARISVLLEVIANSISAGTARPSARRDPFASGSSKEAALVRQATVLTVAEKATRLFVASTAGGNRRAIQSIRSRSFSWLQGPTLAFSSIPRADVFQSTLKTISNVCTSLDDTTFPLQHASEVFQKVVLLLAERTPSILAHIVDAQL